MHLNKLLEQIKRHQSPTEGYGYPYGYGDSCCA